jgi:nitrilase
MIVDPWGEILGVQEEGEGLVVAEIDPERIRDIRRRLN